MIKKIQRKLVLLLKLVSIGASFTSSLTLLKAFFLISYLPGKKPRPFSCRVQVEGRTSVVHFSGTMGEILTLIDIFVDLSYEPKHGHAKLLFPSGIKTCLDLGANIGLMSVWLKLSYPKVAIHAYEPNPKMCALLRKNVGQFDNTKVFESAIASTSGTVTFHQSAYSLESSIFEARDSISISVPAETLDQAIEKIGGSVDFVKIDIEGAEFDVFKQSQRLTDIRILIGEAHTEQSGHPQEELSELLSFFNMLEIYNPNKDTVFGFYAARLTRN